jgi:hypothetical protein
MTLTNLLVTKLLVYFKGATNEITTRYLYSTKGNCCYIA